MSQRDGFVLPLGGVCGVAGSEVERVMLASKGFECAKDKGGDVYYVNPSCRDIIWLFLDRTWTCDKVLKEGMSLEAYMKEIPDHEGLI